MSIWVTGLIAVSPLLALLVLTLVTNFKDPEVIPIGLAASAVGGAFYLLAAVLALFVPWWAAIALTWVYVIGVYGRSFRRS